MTTSAGNISRRSVLITGCSSGIGQATAMDLAKRGWRVFGGVRSDKDARQLLDHDNSGCLTPIRLDITCPASLAAAGDELHAKLGESGLQALVNNAGVLVPGPLELISTAQLRHQMEVNVIGTHAITRCMLPLLRQSCTASAASQIQPTASPRILFMGSISGRVTPPYYGAYSASKHALEAIASAWRMELRPWNICVSVVQPDSIATPIWKKVSTGISQLSDDSDSSIASQYSQALRSAHRSSLTHARGGIPTARVVTVVHKALAARRPRDYYPVGWRTQAAFLAKSMLPTRLMDSILRKSVQG